MCYAIPAKIIEIKGNNTAVIDYFGEHRNALMDLEGINVGDYVYAQGGIIVRKVSEKEALEVLDVWKEMFFELKKADEAFSKIDEDNLTSNVLAILQKINLKQVITEQEMLALLQLHDPNELKVYYEVANNIRQREHSNASCVHGIIEFSNYCDKNCYYCGIRQARDMPRYRMSVEEIIQTAKHAVDTYDFKALVLQSGEDLWYDDDKLIQIVKAVRQMGVLVFLSIGARSKKLYQKLYHAGARAALMRFETADEGMFEQLRPGTTLNDRLTLIRDLKEMGYVLATGFMLGLPSETHEDIIKNVLLTKSLKPDMYSFGPFIPAQQTPLANHRMASKDLVLKIIALTRIVDPNSNILVTTALETLDANAAREGLLAGANSMMINLTPEKYRPLYAIYDNRAGQSRTVAENVKSVVDLLYSLGRSPTDVSL